MVDLSKFTSKKKKKKWSCNLNLQPNLLSNSVQSIIIYVGLRNI